MLLLDNITVAFLTLVTLYVLTVARTVTKLVPSLTEVEQCDDIPQEVSETATNVSLCHTLHCPGLLQEERQAAESEISQREKVVLQDHE